MRKPHSVYSPHYQNSIFPYYLIQKIYIIIQSNFSVLSESTIKFKQIWLINQTTEII